MRLPRFFGRPTAITQPLCCHQSLPTLVALCFFVVSILYCWVAENTSLFEKTSKDVDVCTFLLCIAFSTLVSLRSWKNISNPDRAEPVGGRSYPSLLPREQTEEWKGWMQAVILLYHYFGLSGNIRVYQVIRVLVAAYIFLTGYSHTTYFLRTNDFSTERTLKVLLRLNLLSGVLAYVLDRPWEFYYFPGLTSFWYLVIHTSLYCTRTAVGGLPYRSVLVSLALSCGLVQFSLYAEAGKSAWTTFLLLIGNIGGPEIRPQEFLFRLRLDSFVPYWGAVLAVLVAKDSDRCGQFSERASLIRLVLHRPAATYTPWLAFGVLVQYFLAVQGFKDKVTSNTWHPFHSIVPIAAILVVRNASPRQRHGYNRYFRWLGAVSLEAYILQSHIWLTNRNKGLLHMNIFDRSLANKAGVIVLLAHWLNKISITILFLIMSHNTAQATKPIIDWIMVDATKRLTVLLLMCWMLNLHWNRLDW